MQPTDRKSLGGYRILRRIATGGMAEVYEAVREGPHGFAKRVALKRILPQSVRDPEFVGMFIEEARLAARLDHPNIVQVFDFGEDRGELFIVMELVDGTNLNRVLRKLALDRGTLPLELALLVGARVAGALAHAHRLVDENGRPCGIVHRDVSPANILVSRTGHAKLADFGIATITSRMTMTDPGQVRGKLGYMSPEQVSGRALDGKSDVFTLATVLTELVTGEPLFGIGSEIDVLVRIRDANVGALERAKGAFAEDARHLLMRGLAREPGQRPTALSFATECEEILRRRSTGSPEQRMVQVLERLGLLEERPGDKGARDVGTSLVDTQIVSAIDDGGRLSLGSTSPAIYRVRARDGELLGPMSLPKLIQLFTSGRVDGRSLIAKEESDFAPAADLPELTRFVTSRALSFSTDEILRAEFRGALRAGRLVPVVHGIVVERRTGVLHLFDGDRRKKIYFVDGRPEFVASTDARELLGEYLVGRGFCLRMEVEMALALLPRYGGHLGDALIGLGVLRPVDLVRAITSQVRERLLEAFRWRTGEYAFVADERSHEDTFPLGYDPYEMIRDAVMRAHLAEIVAALDDEGERVVMPSRDPPIGLDAYRLPDDYRRVIRAIDGPTTWKRLFANLVVSGDDPETVHRAFFLARACELVVAS